MVTRAVRAPAWDQLPDTNARGREGFTARQAHGQRLPGMAAARDGGSWGWRLPGMVAPGDGGSRGQHLMTAHGMGGRPPT